MAKRIDDPIFGRLRWDDGWEGTLDITELGGRVTVRVELDGADGPDDIPSDDHRVTMRALLANLAGLRPQLAQALFDHYQRVRPLYAERNRPQFQAAMPPLSSPDEIWPLLSDPTITMFYQEPGQRELTLGWNCSWDVEHGVIVDLRNEEIINVGE